MAFESGEPDGHDFTFRLIGVAVLIMALGTFFEATGIFNFTNLFLNSGTTGENGPVNNRGILDSELDLGDNIVNRQNLTVFQAPAQNPLGRQLKGVRGRIVEGPSIEAGTRWWRVNYENAPNGWVNENYITNKIGFFTALNIIPITFGFLTPLVNIIIVIIVLLLFFVIVKNYQLSNTLKKRQALIKEQKIIEEGHEKSDDLHKDSQIHDKHKQEIVVSYESKDYTEKDFEQDQLAEKMPVDNLPIGEKPKTESLSNRRWANVQTLIKSYNQNDWKQAILEADTILEEMLEKIGYEGNTIGEKLKQVNPDDFITLNHAWEAHKMRNRIAHNDGRLKLSKNEAERVIELYKEVFSEFFYI